MAGTKKESRSRSQLPLALELLEADHRKVEALFEQYEDAKDNDDEGRRGIALQICAELKVHMQVEEELLYPWLREALDDDDEEMVEEAEVEHASAKDLVSQLEADEAIDATYDAKVKVLSEYIKHHVKEEETEVFPSVSDQKEALDELGQEIAARKGELMDELGIGEGVPPDAMKATTAKAGGKAATGTR